MPANSSKNSNMKTNLSNSFNELNESVQDYLKTRTELIKLTVLEKMTKISVYLLNLLSGIIFAALFFFFFSAAFIVWYGLRFNDFLTGLFIVIGFLLFLLILYFVLKRTFITSSIIENLSSILFEDEDKE